jgi:hypothetical protein
MSNIAFTASQLVLYVLEGAGSDALCAVYPKLWQRTMNLLRFGEAILTTCGNTIIVCPSFIHQWQALHHSCIVIPCTLSLDGSLFEKDHCGKSTPRRWAVRSKTVGREARDLAVARRWQQALEVAASSGGVC